MSNDFNHAAVARRAICKMTPADLARQIDVTRKDISMIETGECPQMEELLLRISAGLSCKSRRRTEIEISLIHLC
mgnify:CR=1 FL=1